MNNKAIQKCIDELKQNEPRLDYVLGVLETLVDAEPSRPFVPAAQVVATPSATPGASGTPGFLPGSIKGTRPNAIPATETAEATAFHAEAEAAALGGLIEKDLQVEKHIVLNSGK